MHALLSAGACLLGLATTLPLKETFKQPLPELDEGDSPSKFDDACLKADGAVLGSIEAGCVKTET